MANKAYRFRLYPNAEQMEYFAKTFGCVRKVYNLMLSDRIVQYEIDQTLLSNSPAQYKKEYEYLREVDSLALANAWQQLNAAYRNFFRNPGNIHKDRQMVPKLKDLSCVR